MIIKVRVKPNSIREKFEKISPREYFVELREKAEDGKANNKLKKLLCNEFNINWRAIKIKNTKSRNKIIEINFI